MRTMFQCVFTAALVLTLATVRAQGAEPFGVGLDGKPINQLAKPGVRVVVLFFAASDCPISNRYVPEIARLSREFSGPALFWWVYPNPEDKTDVIARHNREFDLHGNTVLDTQQSLLVATGSLHEAADEQRIALKLLEDDADGWNNLGVLEARTGQTAAARADFEHALRLQPDHAEAKANLARLNTPH